MAELQIELPSVVAVLASSGACDGVVAPDETSLLRVAPHEVVLVGAVDASALRAELGEGVLVEDVSDAWVSFVLEGTHGPEAFARLSELELPSGGWIQGEVARAPVKVLVEHGRLTMLVPAMLAAHVEERIRVDAGEVLSL